MHHAIQSDHIISRSTTTHRVNPIQRRLPARHQTRPTRDHETHMLHANPLSHGAHGRSSVHTTHSTMTAQTPGCVIAHALAPIRTPHDRGRCPRWPVTPPLHKASAAPDQASANNASRCRWDSDAPRTPPTYTRRGPACRATRATESGGAYQYPTSLPHQRRARHRRKHPSIHRHNIATHMPLVVRAMRSERNISVLIRPAFLRGPDRAESRPRYGNQSK